MFIEILPLICVCSLMHVAHSFIHNQYKSIDANSSFLRVCYYSNGDPEPDQLDGTLCTHIIQGFGTIANGTINPGSVADVNRTIAVVNMKKKYPHLVVMFSIGGGGNNSPFSDAVSTPAKRKRLIQSCIDYLRKYKLDGLDIDWEFPVWNDGVPEDKENFISFLRDFKAISTYQSVPLLLSTAVAAPKAILYVYDIPQMAKYVDFINLMSYDYHDYSFYLPFTGHNSPLFNRSVEKAYFATLNTAWSALYWNQAGMPLKKLMVGLPTYGHSYKLLNPKYHDLDSPAVGVGLGGGDVAYPDVCKFLKSGATRVFNEESKVPYAYLDYDWIGYDDESSISAKANWVKQIGFGGVMTFDLNCDDWQGICDGKTKFPLHKLIYKILTSP